MELLVLIGQRKQRYEGQYAPEALAVIDGFGHDDNPDYMRGEMERETASGDFDALAIVRLDVSNQAVREILYPAEKVISAAVIPS